MMFQYYWIANRWSPYGFRTPTNETYNLFPKDYLRWTLWSNNGLFSYVGNQIGYLTATTYSATNGYALVFDYNNRVYLNYGWSRSEGITLRCIEDCDAQFDIINATY